MGQKRDFGLAGSEAAKSGAGKEKLGLTGPDKLLVTADEVIE